MHRYRSGILVLLLFVLFGSCQRRPSEATAPVERTATVTTTADTTTNKDRQPQGRRYKFPPGKDRARVEEMLMTAKLRNHVCRKRTSTGACAETAEQAPVGSREGGFYCSEIHIIELTMTKDSAELAVSENERTVKPGDCVMWTLTAVGYPDPTKATIRLINFLDSKEDAERAGKVGADAYGNPNNLAVDFCTRPAAKCAMGVGLPEGTYRYQVVVKYKDAAIDDEKKLDPDLNVNCGGTCDNDWLTATTPAAG